MSFVLLQAAVRFPDKVSQQCVLSVGSQAGVGMAMGLGNILLPPPELPVDNCTFAWGFLTWRRSAVIIKRLNGDQADFFRPPDFAGK